MNLRKRLKDLEAHQVALCKKYSGHKDVIPEEILVVQRKIDMIRRALWIPDFEIIQIDVDLLRAQGYVFIGDKDRGAPGYHRPSTEPDIPDN